MRLLTPEVEEIFRWFAECYEVTVDGMSGRVWWRRAALPAAGGVGDQDARVMAALEYVAQLRNTLLMERQTTRTREAAHA